MGDDVVLVQCPFKELESQLNKIVGFETDGIITRSHCRWAEEGERSFKYFCNLEKRLCEKKSINRITTADHTVITEKKNIPEEIQGFYSKLYQYPSAEKNCNDYDDIVNIFWDDTDIPNSIPFGNP